MRVLLLSLAILSASAFAQSATTPRGVNTEIDVAGPDVGRGPNGWRVFRGWSYVSPTQATGVITALIDTLNGNTVYQFPNENFDAGYQLFVAANATAANPTEPGTVTANYSLVSKLIFPVSANSESGFICNFTPPERGPISYSCIVSYSDSKSVLLPPVLLTLNIPNTPPFVSLSASPSVILSGGTVLFAPLSNDVDQGQFIAYVYDYGDGNSGTSETHVYASPGIYSASVTANDGVSFTKATTTITVYGAGNAPTARFEVSDTFITVGTPFTVSAVVSTDPQNQIVAYDWSFGDGSTGNGASLSHAYADAGITTITLTVTDAQGLTGSTSRDFDILDANAGQIEDATVSYSARYNRGLQGKDYVKLAALVNIGDQVLRNGDTCNVSLCGIQFGGALNRRLTLSANRVSLKVKNATRKQKFGDVSMTLLARNVTGLGDALVTLLGTADVEGSDVPVVVEVGGKVFTIQVPSDYDVTSLKGKGTGDY